jgi:tetratricopeptide (TPR) repeat protein
MASVFLSYARADDEPFVRRLCDDLTAAGFDVWFDRDDLRSKGLTFHHEIRDAITARDRLVLIVGENAVASEYVRQEWQYAWFDAAKVVTPILRKGDYPLIPDELKLLHCEDFRDDAQYQFHLKKLIASLREPPPPLGKLIGVPSLPAHFLTRADRLLPLRHAVRSGLDSPAPFGGTVVSQQFHSIASSSRHVGMHGMGGIGKSILANLLAHDRWVREAFADGIVWVGLGSAPNLAELMRRVHRDLGGDGAFDTEQEGKSKLKELLADKAVLLVIDDAWRRQPDVEAFNVLGPRCRALITTRDAGLLTALGGTHHLVELLTDAEALQLLAVAVGKEVADLPAVAQDVLKECGRLPLAVSLAGGLSAAGMPWESLLKALKAHKLEFLQDEHSAEPQHVNLWKTIEISVLALPEEEQRRLAELAVFPEDEAVPEVAVATLWRHSGNLDDLDTQQLLLKLKQRSLVQLTLPPDSIADSIGCVSLHDLIHDYCVRRAEALLGKMSALHDQLLAAYRVQAPTGWHTGPNDGYYFEHLPFHLAEAGQWEDLLDAVNQGHLRLLNRWTDGAEFRDGLKCLEGLIDYLRQCKHDSNRAAGLATQVARIHSLTGNYPKAEEWLQNALSWTSKNERRVQAVALHELGTLLLYRREIEKAETMYRQALSYAAPASHLSEMKQQQIGWDLPRFTEPRVNIKPRSVWPTQLYERRATPATLLTRLQVCGPWLYYFAISTSCRIPKSYCGKQNSLRNQPLFPWRISEFS